jgi:hypothetical protein
MPVAAGMEPGSETAAQLAKPLVFLIRFLGRRVVARLEAISLGLGVRFVITSLKADSAEHIYHTLCCARSQAENLIKLHKTQLKTDRASCRSATADQVRLLLRTAA